MSSEMNPTKKVRYYSIVQNELRTQVPKDHPDAVSRINKKGVEVYERVVPGLFGVIENVSFYDGENGRNLLISLDKNEDGETPVFSVGAESLAGEELMKKLPGVDFTKEVRIMPYSFVPEGKEKEKRGISIAQKDENDQYTVKIQNFFYDGEKVRNGYPDFTWEGSSEAERKIHFINANAFLQKYTNENIIPKFSEKKEYSDKDFEYPTAEDEGIRPEDIGF